MDTTLDFFLSVLRYYFKMDIKPDASQINWTAFLYLCRIHNVEGLIYSALKKTGIEVPQSINAELRKGFLATVAHDAKQMEALEGLENEFQVADIQYILFKGAAVKRAYPEPTLRTMGDIDIFIHEYDLPVCDRIMLRLGYKRDDDHNAVAYMHDDIRFEVHTRCEYTFFESKDSTDLWLNASAVNHTACFELNPQYQLVLVLNHMAKHAGRGFGVRMLLDIVAWWLYYPDAIDLQTFTTELEKLMVLEFSKRVFALCQHMFGLESPYPDYVLTKNGYEMLRTYILRGGIFGRYNPDISGLDLIMGKQYIKGKSGIISRFVVLIGLIFPSSYLLQKYGYTYLCGRPFLLPFAWIHRFLKKLSSSEEDALFKVRGVIHGNYGNNVKEMLDEFGLQYNHKQ